MVHMILEVEGLGMMFWSVGIVSFSLPNWILKWERRSSNLLANCIAKWSLASGLRVRS